MRHLGDITKLDGSIIPVVDVITGGSPCQDLSIAGKREGLAGERSGMFMEQMRIVKEMREYDGRCNGRSGGSVRPRFMVWENVPGAFSSNKGEDFRAVLEEIVRVAEPDAPDVPLPNKGKWTKSGCLYDELGRWSVAWRVHDAQYWGVPQRRKRIAVVADFGGLSAPEILFERKGLSWDPDESQPAGEEAAAGVGGSALGAVTLRIRGGCEGGGKGPLVQMEMSGTLGTHQDQTLFALNDQGGSVMGVLEDVTGALRAQEHGHQPVVVAFSGGQGEKAGGIGYQVEVSPSGSNTVPTVLSIHQNASGEVREGEVAYTIGTNSNASGRNTPMVYDARGNGDGQTCPTITGDHENRVTDYTAVCVGNGQLNQITVAEQSNTLDTMHDQQAVMVFDKEMYNGGERMSGAPQIRYDTVAPTVRADSHPSGVAVNQTVRRLTPLECERLQGYPDGWTDIGEWIDSKGKKHKPADTPRYQVLGNSIALPYWKVLLKRISAQYDRDATLGSLFDGIGGFPYLWEQINGKGSAVWASEIEEFPIAVTKRHFPEEKT